MLRTSLPTSSTMPTYSWPIGRGSSTVSMPRYGHRSDPQTQVAASRMTASVGFSMVGSGRSSTRTSPGAYITVPRMGLPFSVVASVGLVMGVVRCLSDGGCGMSGGEDRDLIARGYDAHGDGGGVKARPSGPAQRGPAVELDQHGRQRPPRPHAEFCSGGRGIRTHDDASAP